MNKFYGMSRINSESAVAPALKFAQYGGFNEAKGSASASDHEACTKHMVLFALCVFEQI